MIYGSVCSGIEAASVAWAPLGWRPAWFAEIDRFASAVLAHRHPGVPNLGDFTRIGAEHGPIGLLVGGTPCQDFSIAGKRAGLDGARGNLTHEFLSLARRLRPRWIVWENVPGTLSLSGGRDFAAILGGFRDGGYGCAWRVLDAQYVRVDGFRRAVPQRRRRIFLAGYLGDWRRAASVLFEPEGMRGDSPPRRETGQDPAPTLCARPSGGGGLGTAFDCDGGLVAHALNAKGGAGRSDFESETFVAHALKGEGFDASEDGTGRGVPIVPVAFSCKDHGAAAMDGVSPTLRAMGHAGSHANAGGQVAVAYPAAERWAVRRLTPRECERLQGFPDDYTLVPWRGGLAPDGPRYKALGNSMAVNVMRWIGRRIAMAETLPYTEKAA